MKSKLISVENEGLIRFVLHEETLGITKNALTALRDELARVNCEARKAAVFLVPAAEGGCECYGVALAELPVSGGRVTLIGDGFRGDNGGEGGAGHRAAQALLALFGVMPFELIEGVEFVDDVDAYDQLVKTILGILEDRDCAEMSARPAQYIDWVGQCSFTFMKGCSSERD